MGFKGTLESINLADIFQNLSINQQSGTLRITDQDIVRYIYFDHGQIKYLSRGRGRGLDLDELMLGRGIITKADIEEVQKEASSSGQDLTGALMASGKATPEQFNELAQIRVEEDIYDLFAWTAGQFEFLDGPPPGDIFDSTLVTMQVTLNTNNLIMEAARRIDEWERIRLKIPSTREIFLLAEGAAEGADLSHVESRVVELLDGTRDVDDLIAASTFSRYEVAQGLCNFLDSGWIRPATVDELKKGVSQARYRGEVAGTVKLYERILSMGDDDMAVRTDLAEACAAIGDNEKAAIHFGVVADSHLAEDREEDGVAIYKRIIELVPKHVPSRDKLARIYAERGQRREALEHYRILINAYVDTNRFQQAKTACSAALQLDPGNVDVRNSLAKVYLGEGNREAAVAEFEAVADALAASGKPRAAADIYRRVLQLDKRQTQVRDKLSSVLTQDKDYKTARTKKLVIGTVLFITVLAAIGVVGYEGYAKYRVDMAIAEARTLSAGMKHDEALMVLAEAEKIFSIMHFGRAAEEEAEKIKETQRLENSVDAGKRNRQKQKMKEILIVAQALLKEYKIAEAKEKLKEIDPLEPPPAQRNKATAILGELRDYENFIADYQGKLKANDRRLTEPGLTNADTAELLRTEYDFKRALMNTYRDCPVAKAVLLPVRIRTAPVGCNVYIDGQFKGPAPITHRYPPGKEVLIEAKKPGYREEAVRVRMHSSALLEFSLRREPAWTVDVGAPVDGTPLPVRGLLIVVNRNGRVLALNPRTGKVRWNKPTPGLTQVEGGICELDGNIFFGDNNGNLHALNLRRQASGFTWSFRAQAAIKAAPFAAKVALLNQRPHVFVGSDDGRVHCIDMASGRPNRIWSHAKLNGPIRATPLVMGTQVFVGSDNRNFYVYSVTTGGELGVFRTGGMVRGSPVRALGNIVIGDTDGKLYAFKPEANLAAPEWRFRAAGEILSTPVVDDGIIYFGTTKGKLYAVDAATGKLAWTAPYSVRGSISGSPAVSKNRVYFGCSDNMVYAVDRRSGKFVWKYPTSRPIKAGLAYSGNMVYAASTDGFVYAFKEE